MIYNNKTFTTFSQIFNKGLRLAKEDKSEAMNFFKAYIQYIYEDAEDIHSLEEASDRAKNNFGYFAAYYNQEVCDIIYKTYQCSHPIFGDKPFEVSPEEAYKIGLEYGKKQKD